MKHFKKAILALLSVSILAVSCQPYSSYTDTATVNGTTLFYAAEGRGKPVILLHGNGGSHNDLETTTRQLAQAGYMVYALDSRGQGANKPLDEYHYLDMATDVKEFIDLKDYKNPPKSSKDSEGFLYGGLQLGNTKIISCVSVT